MHYYQMQPYPLYPCVKTTKKKLCALNFSLSFMTFIKNNGFYMKILCYVLKFPEFSGELSGELQPAKKFSSPTPAKSDFLLSADISGDLLETEISTTLVRWQLFVEDNRAIRDLGFHRVSVQKLRKLMASQATNTAQKANRAEAARGEQKWGSQRDAATRPKV